MKKNYLLKTLMAVMTAAVLCGCSVTVGDGPTSVFIAGGSNDDETDQEGSSDTETEDSVEENETAGDETGSADENETAGDETGDSADGNEAADGEDAAETVKSCEEIYEEIAAAVELQSPMIVPEDFVANYGIDFSTVDDYIFVMSEFSTSAETIAIFKSGDEAARESITDALQMFADGKRAEMENYLPEQFDIVDQSSVKTSGEYVYLVISENAQSIEEMIADCLP